MERKKRKKLWEEVGEEKEARIRKMHLRTVILLPLGIIASIFPGILGLHLIFHTHNVSYGIITFYKLEPSVWWVLLGVVIVYAVVFYWRVVFALVPESLKYLWKNKKNRKKD